MSNALNVRSVKTMVQGAGMTVHWPQIVDRITQQAQNGYHQLNYKFGNPVKEIHDLTTLLKNSGFEIKVKKQFYFFGPPVGIKIKWTN